MAGALDVLYTIAISFVVFIFLFSGSLKITPAVNPEMYQVLTEKFRNELVPAIEKGVAQYFNTSIDIDSSLFKYYLGIVEVSMAVSILVGGSLRTLAGQCIAKTF